MRYTQIKGLSERRRLPRLGKIRLGVRVRTKEGNEHPVETDYFVVPPEVARVYGEKPKELEVVFPVEDRAVIFPQALRYYGSSRGLKCIGNGEEAARFNEQTGQMELQKCKCHLFGNGCSPRAHLMVILPKVNWGGVYQIDTGSENTIEDINSGLDHVKDLLKRFALVPLLLKRVPRETNGGGHRRVHYPLQIDLATNDIAYINKLRTETALILDRNKGLALPEPEDVNPAMDVEGVVLTEEQAAVELRDHLLRTKHGIGVILTEAQAAAELPPEPSTSQEAGAAATPPASPEPGSAAAVQSPAAQSPAQSASQPTSQAAPASAPLSQPAAAAPPVSPLVSQAPKPAGNGNGQGGAPSAGGGGGNGKNKQPPKPMTEKQAACIHRMAGELKIPKTIVDLTIEGLTIGEASKLIDVMKAGDFSAFEVAAEMADEERY